MRSAIANPARPCAAITPAISLRSADETATPRFLKIAAETLAALPPVPPRHDNCGWRSRAPRQGANAEGKPGPFATLRYPPASKADRGAVLTLLPCGYCAGLARAP